jgi:hypothetical protein
MRLDGWLQNQKMIITTTTTKTIIDNSKKLNIVCRLYLPIAITNIFLNKYNYTTELFRLTQYENKLNKDLEIKYACTHKLASDDLQTFSVLLCTKNNVTSTV